MSSTVSRASARRRPELAAFLRSRRARVTPADVGMPPGLRRRTPGLRREEVAQLSGVGVTWYTWLEQGRDINASPQVLDAVARTLRLDTAEREHLYDLAGVAFTAGPEGHADSVTPEIQRIIDDLGTLPAAVYNARYDVLATNAVYRTLFPTVGMSTGADRNVLWHLFTARACCCTMVERETELPMLVATFRGAYGRHVGEPRWEGLIRRLCTASDYFAQLWASGDVAPPGARVKIIQHASVGLLNCTTQSLSVAGTPEARIVVYVPADAESHDHLGTLRTLSDPLVGCPVHARPLSVELERQAARKG
ncbi:helix-turn-helix transcriptional regulator [Streptomyces sp. NPDC051940]|uniref:helix-turn-helix transcriptional regulator n=1 Tax=Streptomyces sp. NPDC051940 TaxID=3155675 RepID=UPI00342F1BF0